MCNVLGVHADGIDVQMVSRGPDQGEQRPDQQIPQARFAHGAVRVPSTALDHGKVGNPSARVKIPCSHKCLCTIFRHHQIKQGVWNVQQSWLTFC